MQDAKKDASKMARNLSRRVFIAAVAGGAAIGSAQGEASAETGDDHQRAQQAFQIRLQAARQQQDAIYPDHPTNGDERLYPNKIGNFSKGLPHNDLGEVDPKAYDILVQALTNGSQSNLEQVPMGTPDPALQQKLVNPCAGIAFDLQGADSHHLSIPPAPAFSSAQEAAESGELYWQAVCRDVPFSAYDSDPLTQLAAADLSKFSDIRAPKTGQRVTTGTLFRGFTNGDLAGPYISQFLLKPIPFGAQYVEQRMRTVLPGIDYLTRYSDWLAAQNGHVPVSSTQFDPVRCYVRNGRDLAQWVHVDVLYQAYFNAMLIMLQAPDPGDRVTGGGMGVPLNPGNPYRNSQNQTGFGTFGGPAIATAVAEIATRALKAVWYQKWNVHRRLRPEAFGGAVHNQITSSQARYPVHKDLLNSTVLDRIHTRTNSYLLPVAYPEGCPLHPSYGAGHATVAGASVTILKALFDESFVIPDPVVPSSDGLSLVPYTGPDAANLTVGGELNKLAANVALARNFAGIHWRSDYVESLKLGEAVAMAVLQDQRLTYGEDAFQGFSFTRFDGTRVRV